MFKLPLRTRQALRKIQPPQALWRLGALLCIKSLNSWMATLNYRAIRLAADADPADSRFAGPAIFVFWHEYIPLPVYTRPNSKLAMLLSQHQDAEILSHMAHFAGLRTVRGSTSRGGAAALREFISLEKGISLAITPDGPRGPRRRLAQGCIYLSSRLAIPIVPIGIGYDRPWRNHKSWDRFAFPRPFSRCRAILGPRLQIPADLSRQGIEVHRQWIEGSLNHLTEVAESWACGTIEFEPHLTDLLFRESPPNGQAHPRLGTIDRASRESASPTRIYKLPRPIPVRVRQGKACEWQADPTSQERSSLRVNSDDAQRRLHQP